MALHRTTIAEINLSAFRHNIKLVKSLVSQNVKIMAVVKADAYGHGAIPCAKAALSAGSDCLGVGIIEEGIELRENGIEAPILVMGGITPDEAKDLIRHNLSVAVFSAKHLDLLSIEASRQKK